MAFPFKISFYYQYLLVSISRVIFYVCVHVQCTPLNSQFRVILSTERRKSYYIWAFEVFMYMYVCALSFSILFTYKSMFLWQIRQLLIVLFQQRLRIAVAIGLYWFHCRFNKELGSRPGPKTLLSAGYGPTMEQLSQEHVLRNLFFFYSLSVSFLSLLIISLKS